ncbi:MAG: hypothetical protein Q7P63_14050 [Verrucomicrobiota bacterium JB022]|nr:hypothetical protein [Verrucomicrobiota bacterium JB022]
MQKTLVLFLALVSSILANVAQAQAVSVYTLGYIGPTSDFSSSQTFTGNGYVTAFGSSYHPGLSLDNAKSYFQQDISSYAPGTQIESVKLEFTISGSALDENLLVTLFDSEGTLGFHVSAPNTVASEIMTVQGGAFNSLDLTDLFQTAVDEGLDYFAIHFDGTTSDIFTNGTSTVLTLTVTTAAIPEPAVTALALPLVAGLGLVLRRRQLASRA